MAALKKVMEIMYLTLVPADKSKDTLKIHEKLWSKIRNLIKSITNRLHDTKLNKSNNYDEKYVEIKFHSDGDLPLTKTLEL